MTDAESGDAPQNAEAAHNERGDELTSPEAIDPETALEVIDALEAVLDDGDWWRLRDAVQSRWSERAGKYEYTDQDRNLADKINRLNQIRNARERYEELSEVFEDG